MTEPTGPSFPPNLELPLKSGRTRYTASPVNAIKFELASIS